ncbi:MAG: DUF1684 domain-containing protein [Acidimicrobiia bacterium]|nr:DUF1684 domain-containing protein [Acidimicrobiia bacterium]
MRIRHSIRLVFFRALIALAAVSASACRNEPPAATDYVRKVEVSRASKDASFKASKDPIPEAKKDEFLPLAYFPVDPDYNVPGVLKPTTDGPMLIMPTSTGQQRKMRRVGVLEFALKGQSMRLTAFVEEGARDLDRLFVPFSDMTSGTETYPAGRYMDLDRTATAVYEIDFNYAYQPYCYFNLTYDCPLPPAENRLKAPIRAGEKMKPS